MEVYVCSQVWVMFFFAINQNAKIKVKPASH